MCVDSTDARLFSTGRSKTALGSVHPCASLRRAHSSDQAGCQTNRWSQQREMLPRVFWDVTATVANRRRLRLMLRDSRVLSAQTWRTHDHTPDHVCQRRQWCHGFGEAKRGGWFNGAVMLQPSDHCHMLCGGVTVSSFHLSCVWFNLWDELCSLWTTRSKPYYLTAIFIPDFLCTGFISHIYLHIATQTGNVKARHAG